MTQTNTASQTATPTQTQTQTGTIPETPTMTPTPSSTPVISNCLCFSTTYETIPEDLQVRWRDCETGTVLTQDISTLLQRDNLDGTFTSFICVEQDLSYETPVCVLDGIEVTCDPLIWIEGGVCSDSIDCDADPCTCYQYVEIDVQVAGDIEYRDCNFNLYTVEVETGIQQIGLETCIRGRFGGTAEFIVIENGPCCYDPTDCILYEIDNSAGGFEIEWSGLTCITQSPVGGTVPANTVINTGCIIDGTLNYTGSPIISIVAIC
jgi:hypothetical protein